MSLIKNKRSALIRYSLLIFLFLFSNFAYSTDYYWIGGDGDWSDINHWATSSGGSINQIQTPTANDNVYFDANSSSGDFSVNLNIGTIYCKSFNATLINDNLIFHGSCNLWKVFGSLQLSNRFNLAINPLIYFEAAGGNFQIKSFQKLGLIKLYFKGAAVWSLEDKLKCNDIYLESGVLKTNSFDINGNKFISSSPLTRSIELGSSEIVFSKWSVQGNGYSVNAGTSKIIINSFTFLHNSNGSYTYYNLFFTSYGNLSNLGSQMQFHKVNFQSSGSINGDNIYDSLIFTKGRSYKLQQGKTQIINDDLIANGDCKNNIEITSQASFASISKSSGNIVCYNLILKHIHAVGGASFQALESIDLGDNSGWNIQTPTSRDLYWVGNGGSWNDTIHWSLSSGGQGGECIPTIVDNVFIDQLSFSSPGQIDLDGNGAQCHDFTWDDNVISGLLFSKTLTVSGSLAFGNETTVSSDGQLVFVSRQAGETVKTGNIELNAMTILFEGRQGVWLLLDSVKNSEGEVILLKGHLNTNSQYLHIYDFSINGNEERELSLGSSIIDIEHEMLVLQDTLLVNPSTSHIRFLGGNPILYTDGGNPDEFYNVSFLNDTANGISDVNFTMFNKIQRFQNMIIQGDCISDSLILKKGKTFVYDGATDLVSMALIAKGSCRDVITLREHTGAGQFNLTMPPTAVVDVNDIAIRGCYATGGANFNAINSSDLGMNDNWTFANNSQNHYWVAGGGNWQDSSHWSYNSGGVGGACIPKIYDNVYFDVNSLLTTGDTVSVDTNNIFCKDMDWTGITGNPLFFDTSMYVHFISGSLKFVDDMSFECETKTFFVGEQQNNTIESANKVFSGEVIFADSAQWTLVDSFQVEDRIYHYKGKLLLNLNHLYAASYYGIGNDHKVLDFHDSKFYIYQDLTDKSFVWTKHANTSLITNNSKLIFINGGRLTVEGANGQLAFNDISFLNDAKEGKLEHGSNLNLNINVLLFEGDGLIKGDNYIDTLLFSPGGGYLLEGGQHQYVGGWWRAIGNCYKDISVRSYLGAANAQIDLSSPVSIEYVQLQNIVANGAGPWMDNNGTDLGGNSTNWQIIPIISRNLYWVADGGEWWDTAHWSLNSGGISGECVPTYRDNVFFDNASFITSNDTVIASNGSIVCNDMDWNYIPSEPYVLIDNFNIYGSLKLADTLDVSSVNNVYMHAVDNGNIIRSRNNKLPAVSFIGTGDWTFEDDFSSSSILHNSGFVNTNSNTVSTQLYNAWSTEQKRLNIENSVFNIVTSIKIKTDSFTLNASNSYIHFMDSLSNPQFQFYTKGNHELSFHNVSFDKIMNGNTDLKNYSTSHHHYNKMTINNNAVIIGEHVFDSLIFYAGNTYKLDKSKTQFINDYWFVRGNNCYALNLQSTKKNEQAFVNKVSGVVLGDFLNIRDISVGPSLFFAGSFSTDISNNSGWNFTNGPQYVYGLGADTNFSLGSSVVLSSANFNGGPSTTYIWSTGSTQNNITVNQTGWYYITVSYAGNCTVYDSIFVGCNVNMDYILTHNLCFGDSTGSIQAIVPDTNFYYTYQWSNADTTSFISSLAAGYYSVEVGADSGLCIVFDTLEILQAPQIFADQSDTAFCIGDSVLLDLGSYQSFFWDDNYAMQYRWISVADTFAIKVQDADGCWSMLDTITVRKDTMPDVQLGSDTTICMGENVLLQGGLGFDEYLWSNNSAMSSITISNVGEYWLRIKAKTCYNSDTIQVYNCPAVFIVPNVFTPNGDGYNDYFNIDFQNIFSFKIRIYSRWGLLIFKGSNLQEPWNGEILGQKAVEGVYFWEIEYQEYNGVGGGYETKVVKGTVSIFR